MHTPKYLRAGGRSASGHDSTPGAAGHRPHAIAGVPHDGGGVAALHAAPLRGRERAVRASGLPHRSGMCDQMADSHNLTYRDDLVDRLYEIEF